MTRRRPAAWARRSGGARCGGAQLLDVPDANLKRGPLSGRSADTWAEDPCLTGALAAAFLQGVQSAGVGGCAGRLAVVNQETDRRTLNRRVDERTLQELYLPAFETAVRDGQPVELDAAQLVRDAIAVFSPGAQIPADAVVAAGECRVNEALVTGEADEIRKSPGDTLTVTFVRGNSGAESTYTVTATLGEDTGNSDTSSYSTETGGASGVPTAAGRGSST